jgi:lactoylglutathione lyase
MSWIKGLGLFVAGIFLGFSVTQLPASPEKMATGIRLNHVGLFVKDLDDSVTFYKRIGFTEPFRFLDSQGHPVVYLQINRDTFLELTPATAEHPVGFSHIGLWVDDLNSTVVNLRQKGVKVDDVKLGITKDRITKFFDPDGVRTDLLELPPESLQKKAIDSWK